MRTILLAGLFFIAACENSPTPDKVKDIRLGNGYYRMYDKEHDVVCYTVYDKGISCLQISKQVQLSNEMLTEK